jgi:DNA-binding NarL/FixJ family response regulator
MRRTKRKIAQLRAEIAKYQAMGLKNKEIADVLGISKQLLNHHLSTAKTGKDKTKVVK